MLFVIFLTFFGFAVSMPVHQKAYYKSLWNSNLDQDLVLSPRQKLIRQLPANARQKLYVVDREEMKWPNNIVPYTFTDWFAYDERQYIRKAMNLLKSKTCFKFVEKTNEHRDYVEFAIGSGCFSALGRHGDKQVLSIGEHCLSEGIIIHELLHTLGVNHEHQRPDRDDYVDVNIDNVKPDMAYTYEKENWNFDPAQYPYDIK